jgi:nicotinic acid mononucleotide adenylyltransferase
VDLRGLEEEKIGREIEASKSPGVYLTDAVNIDVSATAIRKAVREGRDAQWQELVALPVADYIRKYQLYGEA